MDAGKRAEQLEQISPPILPKGVYMFKTSTSSHLETLRPKEQDVLSSKIVARATVRHSHGQFVTIICAFQLSSELHFWYTFRAKSGRSPRKAWRCIIRMGVHGYGGKKNDLNTMIAIVTGSDLSAKVVRRFPAGKRNFDASFTRTCYPFKFKNAQVPVVPPSTEYINRKFAAGRRGAASVGR